MEPDEGVVALSEIPEFLLIDILSHLSAPDLLRLGACCKSLQRVAQLDELWKPLVVRNKWDKGAAHPGAESTWMSRYCAEMSIRCLDCFRPTKYVFEPLNRRLCHECERSSYAYRLVTKEQAAEELDLRISPVQLASIRCIDKGSFTFYLQSDLLNFTKKWQRPSKAPVMPAESEDDSQEDEDDEQPQLPPRNKPSASSKQASLKEQRKQNKKATKLLQRAKRQGLETSHLMPTRVPSEPKRPPVFAKKNRSKSECVNAPRQQSAWEKQREELEAEFGQFGISGLVLSTAN